MRRKPFGLQQLWVQIDHDLALFAAKGIRDDGAGHRDELRPNEVLAEVIELLFGHAFAGKAKLDDRNGRSAEVDDVRRKDARRKLAAE